MIYERHILIGPKDHHKFLFTKIKQNEFEDSIEYDEEAFGDMLGRLFNTELNCEVRVELCTDSIYLVNEPSYDLYYQDIYLATNCGNFLDLDELRHTIDLIKQYSITRLDTYFEGCPMASISFGNSINLELPLPDVCCRNVVIVNDDLMQRISIQMAREYLMIGGDIDWAKDVNGCF